MALPPLKWSRLTPYHKFARMVEKHLDGILAYCDKPVSLGYIEGTNLKARNIIRRDFLLRINSYRTYLLSIQSINYFLFFSSIPHFT